MNLEKAVCIASRQYGVVRYSQLIADGMPRASASRILNNDIFAKKAKGVYALEAFPQSWFQDSLIKVYSLGDDALLSHTSALENLGLLNSQYNVRSRGKGLIHVTRLDSCRSNIEDGIHRSVYPHDFYQGILVNSIPQVPTEIAILESASMLSQKYFCSIVDEAIRKELVDIKSLKNALCGMRPAPGRKKSVLEELLRSYTENPDDVTESSLERRVLRVLRRNIDADIRTQYGVILGGRRYRLDMAIPARKIAIEIDGFAFHRDRHIFDSDRGRQNDLVVAGWTVLRFTAATTDEEIVSMVNSAVYS